MDYLERRYLGPSPYRRRKEDPNIQKLHRELLALGIFLIVAIAFFCDTVLEATLLDPFIEEAKAAEVQVEDHEREACLAWQDGMPVIGAPSEAAVAALCEPYL